MINISFEDKEKITKNIIQTYYDVEIKYEYIAEAIFETYYKAYDYQYKKIDFGNYQGEIIFIASDGSLPSTRYDDVIYMYINYGSCTGCDVLHYINYEYENNRTDNEDFYNAIFKLVNDMINNAYIMKNLIYKINDKYGIKDK